jgi:hypothetical protein
VALPLQGLCHWLGEVEGDDVFAGVAVRAPLTRALLTVVMLGTVTGPGPWFAKYSASGTTMMPTITARMKVTAPHSLRTKAQFTSR